MRFCATQPLLVLLIQIESLTSRFHTSTMLTSMRFPPTNPANEGNVDEKDVRKTLFKALCLICFPVIHYAESKNHVRQVVCSKRLDFEREWMKEIEE